jgi:hypothetical protein
MIEMIKSLKETWSYKFVILLAYGLTLICSFLVCYSIYILLNDGIGNSMESIKLLNGFDRTVIEDWMNSNKTWAEKLSLPFIISALLYVLVSIFNNAGLLACFIKDERKSLNFFKNGLKYFVPFLGYALIFMIIICLTAGIIFLIYTKLLGHPINDYNTEKPFFYSLIFVVILLLLKFAYIWIWSVATRCHYIKGTAYRQAIIAGGKTVYKNRTKSLLFICIVFVVFFVIISAFNYLNQYNSGSGFVLLALTGIGIQVSLIARFFARSWANNLISSWIK